jgi:serine/threonine protein kinase
MEKGGGLIAEGLLTGELLDDKYRIQKLLGRGGMGAVYQAIHLGTKRIVAIKVIHPQYCNNNEFIERFRREAEAAGRLRHPNVVDVTDFGFTQISSERLAYLVMEYLDGCTLADVLEEEKQLSPTWIVDILEQVCSAVEEAHRLGIVHRDLKPDNIWLEPNRRGGYTIKVLDFGLVKLDGAPLPKLEDSPPTTRSRRASVASPDISEALQAKPSEIGRASGADLTEPPTLIQSAPTEQADTLIQAIADPPVVVNETESETIARPATDANRALKTARAVGLTRVGSVMGTPHYMSPEQCQGKPVDARSDIYSLGVMAYRMLTGETPFNGNLNELINLHISAVPRPVREKNRKIPRKMARLVMSALAKNPAERPESASGFASALRTSAEGSGALLRRSVSLYSENFPTFLKISLLAYAPLILLVGFINLSDKVVPWASFSPMVIGIIWSLIFLAMIAANLLAYSVVSAMTVPIVVQSMVAPLRPVTVGVAFATLKRRWRAFFATSVVVLAMILVGTVVFVLPGILAAIGYALYAPVAVMEQSPVRATLKRARSLMKRSWSTVLIITLLQFLLPVLVWIMSIDSSFTLKLNDDFSPKEFGFAFDISGTSALYQLLNIFVTPLTAIMTALLYLKTRQAGGESLKDALEQFDALEIPRTRWQTRMRSRAVSQTPQTQSREFEQP